MSFLNWNDCWKERPASVQVHWYLGQVWRSYECYLFNCVTFLKDNIETILLQEKMSLSKVMLRQMVSLFMMVAEMASFCSARKDLAL